MSDRLRVYLDVDHPMASRGMKRVAAALAKHAPDRVKVTPFADRADLHVLHLFDAGWPNAPKAKRYVAIQYCGQTDWSGLWPGAEMVFSYYDLDAPNAFASPLGADPIVFAWHGGARRGGLVTSGFVSGPQAEAIEEAAQAAVELGMPVFHLGPDSPHGMTAREEKSWTSAFGISDVELALKYREARFVSGLRHVEAFELPIVEGAMCGARPVAFDRPEMRRWFDGLAEFVPECAGPDLVGELKRAMAYGRGPLDEAERAFVARTFSWEAVARGFWGRVE